jgi:hypothetical protein
VIGFFVCQSILDAANNARTATSAARGGLHLAVELNGLMAKGIHFSQLSTDVFLLLRSCGYRQGRAT